MKISFFLIVILFMHIPIMLWAAGAADRERTEYLAERGVIVRPEDVSFRSYLATFEYNYPKPEDLLGVYLYIGHHQVSSMGQEEILHIGIQGGEIDFQDLSPMNIAFVIDKSGSMTSQDKMGWVKQSFDIFIQNVREQDFVALIVFDDSAQVVFPSTRMDTAYKRERFKRAVHMISSGGGTNLVQGIKLGYQEVLSNFRKEYSNRVLFLTDGVGESTGILAMAESYKKIGIYTSTIGVGSDFDIQLMKDLARQGGGAAYFISGREEMEKIFGLELDTLVVPIAYNLDMKLEFLQDVKIIDTWGPNSRVVGNKIYYSSDTLRLRDYETIVVQIEIPPGNFSGEKDLVKFTLTYNDVENNTYHEGPFFLKANFLEMESPVTGYSCGMVLKSGTTLRFAQSLKKIGEFYYSGQRQKALETAVSIRKELINVRLRLDDEGFDDEIELLNQYIQIIGGEEALTEEQRTIIVEDTEIIPPVKERSLQEHLDNLFREMTMELGYKGEETISISGFTTTDGESSNLTNLLNEMALIWIAKVENIKVIERNELDKILAEQKLALSDLMDTTNAIQIGKLLTANYILTGSVIEMPGSVVIFGRIINVETAEVESAAQVIVPKSGEVNALL